MRSRVAVCLAAGFLAAGAAPPATGTFGIGYQLYVVGADGTGKRSLSDGVHQDRHVAVARTGRVAFVRETRNAPVAGADVGGIWTMNADGTNARRIVAVPVGCGTCGVARPIWSPDGRRLAFVRAWAEDSGLWVVGANGNGLRRVTPDATSLWGETGLSWAPDGRSIAYQYADPDACGHGEYTNCAGWSVRLVNAAGGRPRVLARNAADPSFSPDGRRVAYLRTEGGETLGLYIVDRDGSKRRAVWPKTAISQYRWTPRGDRLAFTWRNALYSIAPNGRGLRRVSGPSFLVAWSPRGDRIAFTISFGTQVWVMRSNGTGRRRVAMADGFHPIEALAWTRDGRRLFYNA